MPYLSVSLHSYLTNLYLTLPERPALLPLIGSCLPYARLYNVYLANSQAVPRYVEASTDYPSMCAISIPSRIASKHSPQTAEWKKCNTHWSQCHRRWATSLGPVWTKAMTTRAPSPHPLTRPHLQPPLSSPKNPMELAEIQLGFIRTSMVRDSFVVHLEDFSNQLSDWLDRYSLSVRWTVPAYIRCRCCE
jgi:hypothetical protein